MHYALKIESEVVQRCSYDFSQTQFLFITSCFYVRIGFQDPYIK